MACVISSPGSHLVTMPNSRIPTRYSYAKQSRPHTHQLPTPDSSLVVGRSTSRDDFGNPTAKSLVRRGAGARPVLKRYAARVIYRTCIRIDFEQEYSWGQMPHIVSC